MPGAPVKRDVRQLDGERRERAHGVDRLAAAHDARQPRARLIHEIPGQAAARAVDDHVQHAGLVHARQPDAPWQWTWRMVHFRLGDEVDHVPRLAEPELEVGVLHVRERIALVEAADLLEARTTDGEVARPEAATVEVERRGLTR